MKSFIKLAAFILASVTALHSPLSACTGIMLTQKDKTVVHGRTVEFGIPIEFHGAFIPKDFSFTGTAPDGKGLAYKSKYAAVGVYCFDDVALMDGLNEKGLGAGAFYFPGFAGYATITAENQSRALSPIEFPNWILTQFATLEEVKEGVKNVVIAPTVVKGWGPAPAPMHYIVYDTKGNSLIIEPRDGKLEVSMHQLGTITNSPYYEWHLNNLRNYINLSANNAAPREFGGMTLAQFGEGSGLVGMPGDFTPPSRFVRASIFAQASLPSDTSEKGVFQAFHILNQFDIPVGTVRQVENGNIHTDSTQATCVRDPNELKFYLRTYANQNIVVIDLNHFDLNSKSIQKADLAGETIATDISDQFKEI